MMATVKKIKPSRARLQALPPKNLMDRVEEKRLELDMTITEFVTYSLDLYLNQLEQKRND